MKLRIHIRTIVALMLVCVTSPLRAQLVADGTTNTLSNVTNSFIGDVTVGTNGSFTLLVLSSNVLLTNSVNGVIGRNATARSNEVRLISATARWRMGNNLFVGSNGTSSRLVVSNGALVENFDGILASSLASSNNVALVLGGGSTWSNRGDLTVGFSGRENQLIISNGGRVGNRFGYLGRQPGSSSNVARVSGNGSVWTNQFDLTVGANDRSNRLVIEAGGFVTCANGVVSGSSSSGNNEVLVTGPGSLWSNRFFLFMGDVAGRNRLVVSNGATVWSGGSIVGTLSGALSNQVIVTGPGSLWTNDTSLSLADGSPGNRVDVSNGGRLACADGVLGQTLAANSNAVLLTGSGSAWNNRASLIVGNSGSGNTLTASNGATITASNLFVGFTTSAAGNRVTVEGGTLRVTNATGTGVLDLRRGAVSLRAGSVEVDRLVMTNTAGGFDLAGGTLITRGAAISNIGGFTVGGSTTNPATWDVRAGTGVHALAVSLSVGSSLSLNQMLITNGGTLTSGDAYIGSNPGSVSNVALLSGSGSKWTAANLDVGNGGAFNRLIVSNGAMVEDFNGALGQNTGSSNNLAVVTGAGSLWTNRNEMYVGYQGNGNQLVVSNGGTVFALATRFLGHNSGAVSNNTAIVTGAGARWLGPGNLEVGGPGAFCQLLVTDGGRVENNLGLIGSGNSASNNLAVVTGAGSVWTNASTLFVGSSGVGNQLVVSNGGVLRNNNGFVGYNQTASNSLAVITGSGSEWSNAGQLVVGNSSQGNRLVVSNGAALKTSAGYVGYDSIGNNLAVVTGSGSRWTNSGDLFVGDFGAGNRLLVNDGGDVRSDSGFIGVDASASGNLAMVSGPASVWTNASTLFVGSSGAGNQLVVSNGAAVFGYEGVVGYTASSSNNVAVVTGAGSVWSNSVDLFVGNDGSGNQLVVSSGGFVRGPFGTIGHNASSSNNEALVTGPASIWSNAVSLSVGNSGRANRLIVTNGGTVIAGNLVTLGGINSSSNNRVVVHGGALLVTNASVTGTLDVRRGTNVFNSGSIEVDVLRMTNALGKFEFNGGTLVTRGLVLSNSGPFIVGNTGYGPAVWRILPGAVDHFTDFHIAVGGSGSFAQMIHTNGALLTNTAYITIGESRSSRSNIFTLAGPGSRCWMGDGVLVGDGGSDNRLVVRDGASLVTASISYFGDDVTATNNEAVVTGAGSTWFTANYGLRVGYEGSFNRLLVSDGGMVSSYDDRIGNDLSSSNNLATVTGAGSLWNNTRELTVGLNSSGNQLVVSNGGTVFTVANKYVGQNDGARSNTAIVTGPGSAWLGDDSLYVGLDGSFNRLFIRNGGRVTSGSGTLGGIAAADGNQALVADAGSSWTNQLDLNVGEGGSGNRLVISNAATLATMQSGFIGRNNTAASNSVTVTDPASRWLISSNLFVGSNGPAASLVVVNGGRVENSFATLGGSLSSSNNWALISGAGTIWSNRNNLLVGGLSRGNSLVVSNGAQVQSDFAVLSAGLASSNNEVLVSGSGSIWSNRNELHVGGLGPASQLVVANGGRVDCNHSTIGLNTSASNNLAIVTDAGSFWRVQTSLTIGNSSGGNRLVISNGASLFDDGVTIGLFSTNNEALVTGPGTTWTNRVAISVGQLRGHNQLVISNGAFVLAGNVFVSLDPASTNNRVVVHGGTLLVTNTTGGVGALDVRRGTNALNTGLVDVARLFVTNTLGQFEFNGGKLVSSGTAIANGRGFTVGNGSSAAVFELRGGMHSFANNLVVASNASLIGNGTITGVLTTQPGGALAPGVSVGKLAFSNSPVLQGVTIMELSKSGATVTNDQIQVAGPLTYGGSIIVSNLGPTTMTLGDRFQLFSAASYGGAFSSLTLPPLPPGLIWTNKLAVDGSLEVVAYVPPPVTLTIQRSNNFVLLSWPTNAADYCLETSADLTPPVYWQPITGGLATNGASFVLSLPNNAAVAKQFFRLAFPCNTASVTLAVGRSNNLVTLTWPSHAFRLETTFNLAPPVTWLTVTNGIISTGAGRTFTFTNSPAVTNQFFRLAFP